MDVIRRDGMVFTDFPIQANLHNWDWSGPREWNVIKFRLHDNGEQAKREARIEMLRKMAQPNDYDVRPVKTPDRERVKQ